MDWRVRGTREIQSCSWKLSKSATVGICPLNLPLGGGGGRKAEKTLEKQEMRGSLGITESGLSHIHGSWLGQCSAKRGGVGGLTVGSARTKTCLGVLECSAKLASYPPDYNPTGSPFTGHGY